MELYQGKSGGARRFFGQFAEADFWKELIATSVREIGKSMLLAFAGAVTHHIGKNFQGQIAMDHSPHSQPSNSSSAASRAFGVQDTTNYRPSYTSSASGGAQSFPGFGSR